MNKAQKIDASVRAGLLEFKFDDFMDRLKKTSDPEKELENYASQVKRYYRELAKEYHPDLVGESERWTAITAAYNWVQDLKLEHLPSRSSFRVPSFRVDIRNGTIDVGPLRVNFDAAKDPDPNRVAEKPKDASKISFGPLKIQIL